MRTQSWRIIVVAAVAWAPFVAAGCAGSGARNQESIALTSLRSRDAVVQREALLELEGPLSPALREASEAILARDVNPMMCALAADALGRCGASEAAGELRLSVQQDTRWVVRKRALAALLAVSQEDGGEGEILAAVLADDPHPNVRVEAVELAGRTLPADRATGIIAGAMRPGEAEAVIIAAHSWLTRLTGRDIPPTDYERWQEAAGMRYYVVQSGETLDGISINYYGTPARRKDIEEANSDVLQDSGDLRPGMLLVIP
ncbi:MAG: LysM peptidoglycan-binding domain-containing protein [Candidatus Brocadiia bacterium]|jgi:HEAT repeat protein|nr:LysM peptidoglycan-binding domain-containing protein [Candidatus Brocadiia bacterium]